MERGEWDLVQTLQCTGCGGSLVAGLTARRIANATTERHLDCPICHVTMLRLAPSGEGSGSKLDVCPQCSATWFDWEDGGLEDAIQAVRGWPPRTAQILFEFSDAMLARMRCPACGHGCKAAMHNLVATARCTECWGELIPGAAARRIADVWQ
jgi:Zn-finger nucleic acid-binding protein